MTCFFFFLRDRETERKVTFFLLFLQITKKSRLINFQKKKKKQRPILFPHSLSVDPQMRSRASDLARRALSLSEASLPTSSLPFSSVSRLNESTCFSSSSTSISDVFLRRRCLFSSSSPSSASSSSTAAAASASPSAVPKSVAAREALRARLAAESGESFSFPSLTPKH